MRASGLLFESWSLKEHITRLIDTGATCTLMGQGDGTLGINVVSSSCCLASCILTSAILSASQQVHPSLANLLLSQAEQYEDHQALEGVEDAEEDLEDKVGRLNEGQKSEDPGQTKQDRDCEGILETAQHLCATVLVGGATDALACTGQLAHDQREDDEVEQEHQSNDENLTKVKCITWSQETAANKQSK